MNAQMRSWVRPLLIAPIALASAACSTATMSGGGLRPYDMPADMDLPPTGSHADFGQIRAAVAQAIATKGSGPVRKSLRELCAGCPKVEVEIQSIGRTWDIRPEDALSHARIIGRVKNNDANNNEPTYGLRKNTEYLVYLEPKSPGPGATMWLFELPASGTGSANRIWLGDIQRCHYFTKSDHTSDVDFRDYNECDQPVAFSRFDRTQSTKPPGPSSMLTRTANRDLFLVMSGVWFECDSGCCVGTRAVY